MTPGATSPACPSRWVPASNRSRSPKSTVPAGNGCTSTAPSSTAAAKAAVISGSTSASTGRPKRPASGPTWYESCTREQAHQRNQRPAPRAAEPMHTTRCYRISRRAALITGPHAAHKGSIPITPQLRAHYPGPLPRVEGPCYPAVPRAGSDRRIALARKSPPFEREARASAGFEEGATRLVSCSNPTDFGVFAGVQRGRDWVPGRWFGLLSWGRRGGDEMGENSPGPRGGPRLRSLSRRAPSGPLSTALQIPSTIAASVNTASASSSPPTSPPRCPNNPNPGHLRPGPN